VNGIRTDILQQAITAASLLSSSAESCQLGRSLLGRQLFEKGICQHH